MRPGRLPARLPDRAGRPRRSASFWEGERRFDVVDAPAARRARDDVEKIRKLRVPLEGGALVAARGAGRRRRRASGRASINRENGRRYIGIRMNVRGRDLGSFVDEAQRPGRAGGSAAGGHEPSSGAASSRTRSARWSGWRLVVPRRAAASPCCCCSRRSTRSAAAVLTLLNVPFALVGGVVRPGARRHAAVGRGGGRLHRAHRPGGAQRRARDVGHRRAARAGASRCDGDHRGRARAAARRC